MAILCGGGKSPTEIENEWDAGDLNMTLLVHRAQQEARVQMAARHKTDVANIPVPMSLDVIGDKEEKGEKPKRKGVG